jgi:hypothetical protein
MGEASGVVDGDGGGRGEAEISIAALVPVVVLW